MIEGAANVSVKPVLDRLTGRDGKYRKIIARALFNDLYVELPESIALSVKFVSQKTGIAPDQLIIDALCDAFPPAAPTAVD